MSKEIQKVTRQKMLSGIDLVDAILCHGGSTPSGASIDELITTEELYDLHLLSEETKSESFYLNSKGLTLKPDSHLCGYVDRGRVYPLAKEPLVLSEATYDRYGRRLWFVCYPTARVSCVPTFTKVTRSDLLEVFSTEKAAS